MLFTGVSRLILGPNKASSMAAKHRRKVSWDTDDIKRDEPRTCSVSGKRLYATERAANATAADRISDKATGPAQLRTYKCIYCGAWHLTSKEA
jgi:hypothetical protein